jgi:hypothetical protein
MISRDGRDHECHRALHIIGLHGRMSLAISSLGNVARRQIPGIKTTMVAVGDRNGPERVTVPGREWQRRCVKPDTPRSTKPGRQTMMREHETVAQASASKAVTYPMATPMYYPVSRRVPG